MPDQPLNARIVDLPLVAEAVRTALLEQPGLVRLEPTVNNTLKKLKVFSVNALHETLRPRSAEPDVATADGLVLSLTDGVVNAQVDIATDIGTPALGLAQDVQSVTARIVQEHGFVVGKVSVTILSIEGSPKFAPGSRAAAG